MSDVHIARTMQVAMQMAQAVAQSRAELQGERKAIAEEKKKDAKRASLPKGDAKDETACGSTKLTSSARPRMLANAPLGVAASWRECLRVGTMSLQRES